MGNSKLKHPAVPPVLAHVELSEHAAIEILRSRDGSRVTICPMTRSGDGPWRLAGAVPTLPAVLLDAAIEALQQARAALQRDRS